MPPIVKPRRRFWRPVAESMRLGKEALVRRDWDAAVEHFDDALGGDKHLFEAWIGKAHALIGKGALGKAEDAYLQAIENNPGSIPTWVELIQLERAGGALAAASANLSVALRTHPGNPDLMALREQEQRETRQDEADLALGRLRELLASNAIEQAMLTYSELERSLGDDPRLLLAQGEIYLVLKVGDLVELIHTLTRFTRAVPDAWEWIALLGRLFLRPSPMQNQRMAAALCEDAWRISAEHPRAGIGLVEAWRAIGKRKLADSLCQRLAQGSGLEARLAGVLIQME
ncbi:MAG: hypothetical protein JXR83_13030 [Deltaproteobacteria bacterium]|nr:hypothetical protein [Deltaproteobacteria bacterium]